MLHINNNQKNIRIGFYISLLFLLLGFVFPGSLTAQSDNNETGIQLNVNANVVGSMEIITLRNIRLGQVQPSEQMIQVSPLNDAEAGKMKISGTPDATVRISFNEEMSLQQIDGNHETNFAYSVAGNRIDDQSTADLFDFRNQEAQLNKEGEYFIWIGGSVALDQIEPGRYESDFTIEVDHM